MKPSKEELQSILAGLQAAGHDLPETTAGDPTTDPEVSVEEEIALKQQMLEDALNVEGQAHVKIALPEGVVKNPLEDNRIRRVPDFPLGEGVEEAPPKDKWSRLIPELGWVRVTEAEYEAFFRNYLLGNRHVMRTSIQVEPGRYFKCKVQSLPPGEREVLAIATARIVKDSVVLQEIVEKDQVRHLIKADTWLKLEVMTRIIFVEDKDWKHFPIVLDPEALPEEYPDYDQLIRAVRIRFNALHDFALLARSLHQAAVKFTILEDALANRDFTDPAGAGYY